LLGNGWSLGLADSVGRLPGPRRALPEDWPGSRTGANLMRMPERRHTACNLDRASKPPLLVASKRAKSHSCALGVRDQPWTREKPAVGANCWAPGPPSPPGVEKSAAISPPDRAVPPRAGRCAERQGSEPPRVSSRAGSMRRRRSAHCGPAPNTRVLGFVVAESANHAQALLVTQHWLTLGRAGPQEPGKPGSCVCFQTNGQAQRVS
jgi:hypothetical protein